MCFQLVSVIISGDFHWQICSEEISSSSGQQKTTGGSARRAMRATETLSAMHVKYPVPPHRQTVHGPEPDRSPRSSLRSSKRHGQEALSWRATGTGQFPTGAGRCGHSSPERGPRSTARDRYGACAGELVMTIVAGLWPACTWGGAADPRCRILIAIHRRGHGHRL